MNNTNTSNIEVPQKFRSEWKILTKTGVRFELQTKHVIIKGLWKWEEDDAAKLDSYKIFIKDKNLNNVLKEIFGVSVQNLIDDSDHIFSDICYKSKEYDLINKRIKKFIEETEKYGIDNYKEKDYLWDWFWTDGQ